MGYPNPYDFQHTLGIGGKETVQFNDDGSIDVNFLSTAVLNEATMVKISADMTVVPVTAVTDQPLGLSLAGKEHASGKFTAVVKTPFVQIVRCIASGVLAAGDLIDAEALDATTTLMKYKAHAAGDSIVGQVLIGAADTAEAIVGIYRTPVLDPV